MVAPRSLIDPNLLDSIGQVGPTRSASIVEAFARSRAIIIDPLPGSGADVLWLGGGFITAIDASLMLGQPWAGCDYLWLGKRLTTSKRRRLYCPVGWFTSLREASEPERCEVRSCPARFGAHDRAGRNAKMLRLPFVASGWRTLPIWWQATKRSYSLGCPFVRFIDAQMKRYHDKVKLSVISSTFYEFIMCRSIHPP